MGIGDSRDAELTIFVDPDASITVDVGSRFVAENEPLTTKLNKPPPCLSSMFYTSAVTGATFRSKRGNSTSTPSGNSPSMPRGAAICE